MISVVWVRRASLPLVSKFDAFCSAPFANLVGNTLPLWKRLALFLIAEHVVLMLQSTVQFLIPESARDVEEIKLLVSQK